MSEETRANLPSESTWPSVDLAYEFVRPSYDWVLQRLDSVEGRIQTTMSFAAGLTIAAPVLVGSIVRNVNFTSWWLVGALVLFVVIAAIGVITTVWGGVRVISIAELYEKWLSYPELEFKRNAIYWAGESFKSNQSLVDQKGRMAIAMSVVFLLEVLFLAAWAITERG